MNINTGLLVIVFGLLASLISDVAQISERLSAIEQKLGVSGDAPKENGKVTTKGR